MLVKASQVGVQSLIRLILLNCWHGPGLDYMTSILRAQLHRPLCSYTQCGFVRVKVGSSFRQCRLFANVGSKDHWRISRLDGLLKPSPIPCRYSSNLSKPNAQTHVPDNTPKQPTKEPEDVVNGPKQVTPAQQRKRDWDTVKKLLRSVWPKNDWDTRGRIILGFVILAAGKV